MRGEGIFWWVHWKFESWVYSFNPGKAGRREQLLKCAINVAIASSRGASCMILMTVSCLVQVKYVHELALQDVVYPTYDELAII